MGRHQAEGLQLKGEGGLLQQLTKRLLESALEGEITNHLAYNEHDPEGKNGGNSPNGKRGKSMLADVGSVEISVPRDRTAPSTRRSSRSGNAPDRPQRLWHHLRRPNLTACQ